MASALALQYSTNWAMETHMLGADQFIKFIFTRDRNPIKALNFCRVKLQVERRWSHLYLICIPAVQLNFISSISCYVTISNNSILLCMLFIYKWKQINPFLLPSLFSLIQILMGQTLIFLHSPSVFIPKRLWFFRCFNSQNVFPRRSPFQNFLINGWK